MQLMSTALEGEEYVPARQQDFDMAAWVRSCIANMSSDVGRSSLGSGVVLA
jgi:hypothetical protein